MQTSERRTSYKRAASLITRRHDGPRRQGSLSPSIVVVVCRTNYRQSPQHSHIPLVTTAMSYTAFTELPSVPCPNWPLGECYDGLCMREHHPNLSPYLRDYQEQEFEVSKEPGVACQRCLQTMREVSHSARRSRYQESFSNKLEIIVRQTGPRRRRRPLLGVPLVWRRGMSMHHRPGLEL